MLFDQRSDNRFSGSYSTRQAGMTLVEVVFAILIFIAVVIVLLQHVSISYVSTTSNRNRVFAYAKAQAILAEMHAMVESTEETVAKDLDALDDGVLNNATLSITQEAGLLVAPSHPISGNTQRGGQWQWARRIEVRPFAGLNNRNVRYVSVHMYRRGNDGVYRQIATLSSVVNSVGSGFPTTQVYDVFLPIESVVIGDVETCRRKIARYAEIGCDRLMCLMQFGGLPQEAVLRSMRVVGETLLPEAASLGRG